VYQLILLWVSIDTIVCINWYYYMYQLILLCESIDTIHANMITCFSYFFSWKLHTLQRPWIYYTKLMKSHGRAHHGEQHIFASSPWRIPSRSAVPMAGAPIAGIRSQAKRTTAKLEYLKFTTENKFLLKKLTCSLSGRNVWTYNDINHKKGPHNFVTLSL
jgi:hypothetical protein